MCSPVGDFILFKIGFENFRILEEELRELRVGGGIGDDGAVVGDGADSADDRGQCLVAGVGIRDASPSVSSSQVYQLPIFGIDPKVVVQEIFFAENVL